MFKSVCESVKDLVQNLCQYLKYTDLSLEMEACWIEKIFNRMQLAQKCNGKSKGFDGTTAKKNRRKADGNRRIFAL